MSARAGACGLALVALVPAPEGRAQPASPPETATTAGFAVYTLSRGRGVPEPARSALRDVRAYLESERQRGIALQFEVEVIGIEGERRLCASFDDRDQADVALARTRVIAQGVDLVNVDPKPCVPEPGDPP